MRSLCAFFLLAFSAVLTAQEKPRVVALAPHLTELAYAAGVGESLVGAVEYSDWPAEARALPRVGDAFRFDLEKIVDLDADLALAWTGGTPEAVESRLDDLGIELLWIETGSLAQIASALEILGERLGAPESGRRAAERFRDRLASLGRDRSRQRPVRIFYQVSKRPLYTLGSRHVINEVFERCGATNIFSDLDREAATVSVESVLARSPDMVIAGREEGASDPLARWRDSGLLGADVSMAVVDASLLVRPTPRIVEGVRRVCRLVDEAEG
jgi:iron complex transport system substrate-binding protein